MLHQKFIEPSDTWLNIANILIKHRTMKKEYLSQFFHGKKKKSDENFFVISTLVGAAARVEKKREKKIIQAS